MIKVLSRVKDDTKKEVLCKLFADSSSDIVPNLGTDIVPEGYKVAMGSRATTASGDVYYMKSNGTWNKAESGGGGDDGRIATDEEIDDAIDGLHI